MLAAVICWLGRRCVNWGCRSRSVGGEGFLSWRSVPETHFIICCSYILFQECIKKLCRVQTLIANIVPIVGHFEEKNEMRMIEIYPLSGSESGSRHFFL